MTITAVLALEDGTIFNGQSIGAKGNTTGEVVFNTALTGYQEILSDPSYSRQIVTLTYPHIGNTGTTPEDLEAPTAYAAGLVVRDVPPLASNWRKNEDLREFLTRHKVVAISGIDTRKLTRILREKGAQAGCIMTGEKMDPAAAVRLAKKFPGLKGMDLAKVVTHQAPVPVERRLAVAAGKPPGDARASAPARRGLRLRREAQHPAHACRSRLPHDGRSRADYCRRGAGARSGRRVPLERSRRSGAVRLRHRGDPRAGRRRFAHLRHLPRATSCSVSRVARAP